jgi:hypothetical protein
MAMLTAKERELLERGLQWVGFKQKKRTPKVLVQRCKSMFGEGPVAINKLFKLLCKKTYPVKNVSHILSTSKSTCNSHNHPITMRRLINIIIPW